MQRFPTVVLEHTTDHGRHFDWLLATPDDPAGPLWTARMAIPVTSWHAAGTWLLEALPAHRRAFLQYQGPLTQHRGTVRRCEQGHHEVQRWTPHDRILAVHFRSGDALIHLQRLDATRWQARWLEIASSTNHETFGA